MENFERVSPTELAMYWYGDRVPLLKHDAFIRFAARSSGILSIITDKPVKITGEPTANTDGEEIHLPAGYFKPAFYEALGYKQDQELLAICMINGSSLHEGWHVNKTPWCFMKKLAEDYPTLVTEEMINSKAFLHVANIGEDLFIESWGHREYPRLSMFVQAKNTIALGKDRFKAELKEMGVDSPPPAGTEISTHVVMNSITFLKNEENRSHWLWESVPEIFDMFMQLTDPDILPLRRVELFAEIYKALQQMNEQQGGECNGFKPEEGDGEEIVIDLAELVGTEMAQKIAAAAKTDEKVLKELSQAFQNAVEKNEKPSQLFFMDNANSRTPTITYEEIVAAPGMTPLAPANAFDSFARYFRYMVEEKSVPGQPMVRGSKLVKSRLWRIQTDGKVLTNYTAKDLVRGKPEIVMLLDYSGSTECWYSDRDMSLRTIICTSAEGAFGSLLEANVAVAVYAHTSQRMTEEPVIYGIAANRMPLGKASRVRTTLNYPDRFTASLEKDARNNWDGFAIQWCSKQFTKLPGSKVLIVWSDGLPNGGMGYGGEMAVEHTREVAKEIRASGIAVLSMSLVEDVVNVNDSIYGQRNNVRAYGNLLGPQLQKVLREILVRP